MIALILAAQMAEPLSGTPCDRFYNQPKQQLVCLRSWNEKTTTGLRNRLAAHRDYERCVYSRAADLASEPEIPSMVASVAARFCLSARTTLSVKAIEQAQAFGDSDALHWASEKMKDWDKATQLEATARVIAARRGEMLPNDR